MFNKKMCGHDFNEDCECAAKGLNNPERRKLIYKTMDLFSESRNIYSLISSLKERKQVKEDPKYVSYIYAYTDVVLRGCNSFTSSCARSDIGLIGAVGASRTLFEIGINTLYIKKDKIRRLQQFIANAAGNFEKGVNYFWKLREKENMEIPEMYRKSVEDLKKVNQKYGDPRASSKWSGRGVGGRADDVEMKKVYNYIYPLLSSIAHASSIQMFAYSQIQNNDEVDNIVKLQNTPNIFSEIYFYDAAWMVVLWSLDLMMCEFIKVFEIPYRDTMDYRKISSFTNEAVKEYFELCELSSEK